MHEHDLIEAFALLWKNRSAIESTSIEEVKKLIRAELRDEFTHPRVRRTPMEKFQFAIERVDKLEVREEVKHELMRLYNNELTSITDNVNPI